MLKAYGTIVLSDDETYPGLITKIEAQLVVVVWYKWGYDHQSFIGWLTPQQAIQHTITKAECIQRFRALPPNYEAGA
jgi:hypothetical protein